MNTKILDQLEFNKVKDQFTEYLQTEQAQAELRDLVPMTNPERIQNQFTEIQEMAEIFVEHHGFAIGSLRDISEPLRRLELDADLTSNDIAIDKDWVVWTCLNGCTHVRTKVIFIFNDFHGTSTQNV